MYILPLFCSKKYGTRHNKSGNLQRFLSSNCKRTFSINIGFEKMKYYILFALADYSDEDTVKINPFIKEQRLGEPHAYPKINSTS